MLGDFVPDVSLDRSVIDDELAFEIHPAGINYSADNSGGDNSSLFDSKLIVDMSEFEDLSAVPKIQVLIRKRPLTTRELKKNEADIVKVVDENTIVLAEVK